MGGSEDSIRAAFETATAWNEWATAAVVFGVVIELIALLVFSKEMPRNEKLALLLGSILVVVGVAGEYVFGSRATNAAAELQSRADIKIASAEDQAATATADAALLGVRVGELDQFVKEQKERIDRDVTLLEANEKGLNKATKTAEMRSQQLKAAIEKSDTAIQKASETADMAYRRTMPRMLLGCGPEKDDLSKFPKTRAEILYSENASDAFSLAFELNECLKESGWAVDWPLPLPAAKDTTLLNRPAIVLLGASEAGITVLRRRRSTDKEKVPFADDSPEGQLVDALKYDLQTHAVAGQSEVSENVDDGLPTGTIRVIIGPKP